MPPMGAVHASHGYHTGTHSMQCLSLCVGYLHTPLQVARCLPCLGQVPHFHPNHTPSHLLHLRSSSTQNTLSTHTLLVCMPPCHTQPWSPMRIGCGAEAFPHPPSNPTTHHLVIAAHYPCTQTCTCCRKIALVAQHMCWIEFGPT